MKGETISKQFSGDVNRELNKIRAEFNKEELERIDYVIEKKKLERINVLH